MHELAERAGISGRALRYYHCIGLLTPDRVGANGYRYYGIEAVTRLQRVLLLRETGMALSEIADVVKEREGSEIEKVALQSHLERLDADRDTLERRIAAVQHALAMRSEGREPKIDVMLQGFNDAYEAEVVERWGRAAFDASNRWWHGKTVRQQRAWKSDAEALLERWNELQREGCAPDSMAAQAHATTHLDWFAEIPGTPTNEGDRARSRAMVLGVADQYESDPEFHLSFGSAAAARFAATALRFHVRAWL